MGEVGAPGACSPRPEAWRPHLASPVAWMWGQAGGWVKLETGHCVSAASTFTSPFLHGCWLGPEVLLECGVSPGLVLWWAGWEGKAAGVVSSHRAKQPAARGELLLRGEVCCPAQGCWHPLVLPIPLPSCKGLPLSISSLHPCSLSGQP